MTTPPIPEAMRSVAARALFEHDRTDDDPPWDDLTHLEAASYFSAVDSVLAAAFEVCEVQPRFRVHWVAKNGDPEDDLFSGDYDTVERAQEHVAAFDERDRRREHEAVIEQSLEIFTPVTSPAEQVDTEGATT